MAKLKIVYRAFMRSHEKDHIGPGGPRDFGGWDPGSPEYTFSTVQILALNDAEALAHARKTARKKNLLLLYVEKIWSGFKERQK